MRHINPRLTALLAVPLLLLLACQSTLQAQEPKRSYDMLTAEELARLARLETHYFQGVREEALKLVGTFFDTQTIIQTFTPQVRIIRQRKREELKEILRYLSSMRLEQEFITLYVNILRDEVVDHAVDAIMRKSQSFRR